MKKIVSLVAIVVVVALAGVLAMRYYPQLHRPATPADTAGELKKATAPEQAKPTELDAASKQQLDEISKIADPRARQDQLVSFYRDHDVDHAIRLVEDEMKANPDPANWLPSAQLVECYLQKNDLVNAEKYLKNILQGEQKQSYPYRTAANFYVQKKDYVKAGEMLDKALKFGEDDENRAFTYGTLAKMNVQQGDREKAREALQKAIKLAPKIGHFKQQLSQLDETKGK